MNLKPPTLAGPVLLAFLGLLSPVAAQSGDPVDLASVVSRLGAYDFQTRTDAARVIRRADAVAAIRVLDQAARSHADSYVRFRALVLLSAFGEAPAGRTMRDVMTDPNDRLRTAAYQWFEHQPDRLLLPALIDALANERSEFARPALTRAIAAQGVDPRARKALVPLVSRGEDVFRGAAIEALGDYRGTFALPAIVDVAKRDGPLQDDAITALGKMGDRSVLPVLATLRQQVPPELQPTVAAAFCLMDIRCDEQGDYLRQTFAYAVASDSPPVLRGVVHALVMLAAGGHSWAFDLLLDGGSTPVERVRAPVALGIGTLALRRPRMMLEIVDARGARPADLALVRDAFDMLSEEFEEEQCYAELRRQFWNAPAGSSRRQTADQLMTALEF